MLVPQSLEVGIWNRNIALDYADNDQVNLKYTINKFKKITKPRNLQKKNEKELSLKNVEDILTGRQWVNNPFESGIFPVRNMSISDDEDFFYL